LLITCTVAFPQGWTSSEGIRRMAGHGGSLTFIDVTIVMPQCLPGYENLVPDSNASACESRIHWSFGARALSAKSAYQSMSFLAFRPWQREMAHGKQCGLLFPRRLCRDNLSLPFAMMLSPYCCMLKDLLCWSGSIKRRHRRTSQRSRLRHKRSGKDGSDSVSRYRVIGSLSNICICAFTVKSLLPRGPPRKDPTSTPL